MLYGYMEPLDLIQQTLFKKRKLVDEKEKQIIMRRELLQTMADSDTNIKRLKEKINNVEGSVNNLHVKEGKSISYYNDEKEKAKIRMNKEIEQYTEKYEKECMKAKDKYNDYEIYCNKQIERVESSINNERERLEDKINKCNNIIKNTIDEENDRILVKLKLELVNLNKDVDETVEMYNKLYIRNEQQRNAKVAELKRSMEQRIASEERLEEQKKKEALLEIKCKKEKEIRDEEERYKKHRVITHTVDRSSDRYTDGVKQFRRNYKTIYDDDKYKEYSSYYDTKISVFEALLKSDLEELITLTNQEEVIKYLDDSYDFYYLKFHFDQDILNNKHKYNKREIDIYNNLNVLVVDYCGYRKFFNYLTDTKRKKYLKELENDYINKLKPSSESENESIDL